ncbi:hypothetical protein HED60_15365 [Planctomycetales bacterium ZRK34]|nr:hypothetical protein HED60_15365 [Planctomycetales bacterium ZRK34]
MMFRKLQSNVVTLVAAAVLLVLPSISSAADLLVGWYEFGTANGEYESGAGKSADVGAAGLSGTVVGGDGNRSAWSSTDGFFGGSAFATGAGDTASDAGTPTANGAMTVRTLGGDQILSVTVTNSTSDSYVYLDTILFDLTNLNRGDVPDTLTLRYASGDLNDADNTFIQSATNLAASGTATGNTFSDWTDFGWSLASLTDLRLSVGESATFQFIASDAINTGAPLGLDNIALTGTVSLVPTPAALPAGLMLMALGAVRRRRK